MILYNLFVTLLVYSLFQQCQNNNRNTDLRITTHENHYSSYTPDSLAHMDTSLTYIMGKFNPEEHAGFVEVDTMYADRKGLFLREDTYEAFQQMFDHALKDGVRLTIRSATRNFTYQKGIWERKWKGETKLNGGMAATEIQNPVTRALTILKYSSMPGTSRHHWGTDIDLNAFNNTYFSSGDGLKLYNWLQENAHSYGFCQPYTKKDDRRDSGYEEEKWHWSYLPVSRVLTNQAREYLEESMITGFLGSETASEIQVVEKYVLGINPDCL